MNVKFVLLIMVIVILFFLNAVACEKADSGSSGETTDTTSDDDTSDSDDEDETGCTAMIVSVYGCNYFFFNSSEVALTQDGALIECLAMVETSAAWKCRINCAQALSDCDDLKDCLVLCPDAE